MIFIRSVKFKIFLKFWSIASINNFLIDCKKLMGLILSFVVWSVLSLLIKIISTYIKYSSTLVSYKKLFKVWLYSVLQIIQFCFYKDLSVYYLFFMLSFLLNVILLFKNSFNIVFFILPFWMFRILTFKVIINFHFLVFVDIVLGLQLLFLELFFLHHYLWYMNLFYKKFETPLDKNISRH